MATWQQTSIIMLRAMLNDAGCGEAAYSTTRLEQLLITAAYFIPIEIEFNTVYTVNVESQTITPNPIEQDDGADFISFMVLKAACLLDESAFRTAALMQGIMARCGPAMLQTSNYGQYLKELLTEGPCKSYQTLSESYNFNYDSRSIIRAVMSPFASNNFDPGIQGGGTSMLDIQNPYRSRYY